MTVKKVKNSKSIIGLIALMTATVVMTSGLTACAKSRLSPPYTDEKPSVVYNQSGVQLAHNEINMGLGESAEMPVSAYARLGDGRYVTSYDGFTYESTQVDVVSVAADGKITARKAGSAEITVKHEIYDATASFKVNVFSPVTLDFSHASGINVYGRADCGEDGITLINAASGAEIVFRGTTLTANLSSTLSDSWGKDRLSVVVDGVSDIIEVNGEKTLLAKDLTDGIHSARLYKLLDESKSQIHISDFECDGKVFYDPQIADKLKISVYGDGAASGSGLDTGVVGSYAFAAAQRLNADVEFLSIPNVTVNDMKDAWDNRSVNSPNKYDMGDDHADVIVIDIGEGDAKRIGQDSSGGGTAAFVADYKAMIEEMMTATDAEILCCYGATPYSKAMSGAIERAIKTLNDGGNNNVHALKLVRADEKLFDVGKLPDADNHAENANLLFETVQSIMNGKTATVKYDAKKQDIHVILMGGQSNMEGNSHWRYLIDKDEAFDEYYNGFDGIKLSFANHENLGTVTPDFKPVKLGHSVAMYPLDYWNTDTELSAEAARYGFSGTDYNDTFGPDIAIAKTLHDNGYDNKVALIKFAIGGTYFYPRNATDNRLWTAPDGTLYKAFIAYVKACLAELSETYNVYLDAMFWMQGESDTIANAVKVYKNNLNNFVEHIRVELSDYASDFIFYDGLINWEWEHPEQINDIKSQLADENIYHRTIASTGLVYKNEPINNIDFAHYDAAEEIKLGKLFAEAYMKDFPVV